MSFILDALKKSEIERQRQTEPGLMDSPIHRRRNRLPLWALLLGALLVINTVVLIIVLMRNASPGAPAAPAAASSPAPARAQLAEGKKAAAAADHFSPLDNAPVYAPEIPVTGAEGSPAGSGAARPAVPLMVAPLAPPLHASAPRAVHRPDPLLTDEDARADNEEVLPSISELNLSGSQTLPELHLDVHVYATSPADRFVYINMRKYHEGAALQEGPTVEHIRRDGVVLNYQGLRFLLPRQL
jgi:general secretion pathway protein B